ncbi:MAG TPA: TolC family protein [Bacteroidales bacterium]
MVKYLNFCFLQLNVLLFAVFLFFSSASFGQVETNLNLDSCLNWAKQNYPLIKQKGYLQDFSENNIDNINSKWLPQVNVVATASHQTEATVFALGSESLAFPKDNYSYGLHVTQTLFDFGLTSELKKVERAGTQSEVLKNEIELYKLNDKVLQLYGGLLVSKENIKILESYLDDLKNRQAGMASSVNNGAMLQSNLDVLDVELLRTSQKLIEANTNFKVLCQTLGLLLNKQIDEKASFAEISTAQLSFTPVTRPELQYFESQQSLLDERAKLLNRKSMPYVMLFGEGAYGTTGYDMLKTDLHWYGIFGARLTWNINSIHSNHYEKSNLKINKSMVDEQKELFQLSMNTTMVQVDGEISKLKDMIQMDSTIVNKRISVSKTSASQLENGAITSADYLSYLNAEKQAVLSQHIHEIQLGIAIKNKEITSGIKF